MQPELTRLACSNRYSLVSMPDDPYGRPGFLNAPQHPDSREGSPHGYSRSRNDITPLLMLPAPIAVSPTTGTPSASSSLADAPYVRTADPSLAMSPYPLDVPGDSEREAMFTDSNSIMSGRPMGPNAVIRAAPGQIGYPGETPNPYRNSQPQMASYDQAPMPQVAYGYVPEPTIDEYQQHHHQQYTSSPSQLPQQIPSPPQQPQQLPEPERTRRQSRGVSLVDHGPVGSPDTPVRRVANRQSRRQSGSHGTPRYNQRNSALLPGNPGTSPSPQNDFYSPSPSPSPQHHFLPPGAAPPQPRGYPGPQ